MQFGEKLAQGPSVTGYRCISPQPHGSRRRDNLSPSRESDVHAATAPNAQGQPCLEFFGAQPGLETPARSVECKRDAEELVYPLPPQLLVELVSHVRSNPASAVFRQDIGV